MHLGIGFHQDWSVQSAIFNLDAGLGPVALLSSLLLIVLKGEKEGQVVDSKIIFTCAAN